MKPSDTAGTIVAHRNDGMGARIIAILNAIRVARDYDVPYFVGWTTHGRTREEVRDPSNIFDTGFIAERFFDVEVMQEIYEDIIDLDTLPNDAAEADFRAALAAGKCYMSGAAMGITVLPWENADEVAARLPACIEELQFAAPVSEMIAHIKTTFAGTKLTAYHIRRGDIIHDPIASNKLWPNKFIPREFYEQHLDLTLRDPDTQVLCFSDTPIEVDRLKERGDRVQSFKDLLGDREFSLGARDFLELYAMSRCAHIFGPPSSAFSQTAMTIGGATLNAVQDALPPDEQADAMDRMTDRLEARSELFLNMGDVGQCLHFLVEHQTAKGNSNRAKRIIRDYMEEGLDKSFAYQLLCQLSVKSDELDYCERVRALAYTRPVYVDDSMACVNGYAAINSLVEGKWGAARERLMGAVWFRPLDPLTQGALNLALTADKVDPSNFYPFDPALVRPKGGVFPNGKPAMSALNVYTPKHCDPEDRRAFHPWDLVVRDWRMVMGKRLNRAFTNRSKIQKTADMLTRSFSKKAGTPELTSALGVLQLAMGDTDAALVSQRSAIAAMPENPLYRKRVSDILFEIGNEKTALFQLEEAAQLTADTTGEHPCYMAEMGQRFWKAKRRDECAALFDKLAKMDHNFIEIHLATADMLRRKDERLDDALVAIDKALKLGHGSQRLMSAKARILMLLERPDEAEELYEIIVNSGQGTEHTHVEIYRNYKKLGRIDIAKGLTDRSIYDFDMVVEMAGD